MRRPARINRADAGLGPIQTSRPSHLRVHPVGRAAQGQFAERDQVPFAEELLQGPGRLLRHVDPAFTQPFEQDLGRDVDQLDLVGALEHGVGHGLPHHHAGDLRHHVVQALEVLDVERGVDADAGREQLVHVLPPLGVARAGRVGVRQLVDQDQRRMARERGVEVELVQRRAAVRHPSPGEHLQPVQQALGLGARVGLHHAGHDVLALSLGRPRRLQHGVGFAHAGRRAEKELEATAARARLLIHDPREEGVGIGSLRRFHWVRT
jgi:hypothetical protein